MRHENATWMIKARLDNEASVGCITKDLSERPRRGKLEPRMIGSSCQSQTFRQ